MTRALIALVLLTASGCVSRLVPVEGRPSAAEVSAQDVTAGAALYPFQAVGGLWGYMDVSGQPVVLARFETASPFSEGRASVREGGRVGFVDPAGRLVVAARYTTAEPFTEGRARVSVGTGARARYGYVAPDGAEVVPPTFPQASNYSEGRALVRLRRQRPSGLRRLINWLVEGPVPDAILVIDRDGATVLTLPHRDVLPFAAGLAPFQASRRRWGYLRPDGEVAIEPRFEGPAFLFSDGLARVGQDDRVGYIDTTGRVVIEPTYDSAGPFSEGLAAVAVDERWGYVDRAGRVVVPLQYDAVGPFSEGLAVVQVNGRHGYIDRTGAVVIAPQFLQAQAFRGGLALVADGPRAYSITPTGQRVGPAGSR